MRVACKMLQWRLHSMCTQQNDFFVIHTDFPSILSQCYFMGIKCFYFSCRAICPDFFVGQEVWKPSNDWASFDDWLKTRQASKIDKYNCCSWSSLWTCFFSRNFCISKDSGLGPKLLMDQIQMDVQKQKILCSSSVKLEGYVRNAFWRKADL